VFDYYYFYYYFCVTKYIGISIQTTICSCVGLIFSTFIIISIYLSMFLNFLSFLSLFNFSILIILELY